MIKVSVSYPDRDGGTFDMKYYCDRHISMVQKLLGTALKGVAVEQGIAGGAPGARPLYIAMGHLLFDSIEAFQGSFGKHEAAIRGDVPSYTNLVPTIQVSEVKL